MTADHELRHASSCVIAAALHLPKMKEKTNYVGSEVTHCWRHNGPKAVSLLHQGKGSFSSYHAHMVWLPALPLPRVSELQVSYTAILQH